VVVYERFDNAASLKKKQTLMESWIKGYPDPGQFATDGDVIIHKTCDGRIPCSKNYQINQHVNAAPT